MGYRWNFPYSNHNGGGNRQPMIVEYEHKTEKDTGGE